MYTNSQIKEIFDIVNTNRYDTSNTKDKIVSMIFLESSTRTKYSFISAAYKMGMKVIDFSKEDSSMQKGESIEDTIKTMSIYSDVIILRTNTQIPNYISTLQTNIPIINAGSGSFDHPTQALIDLYTIIHETNTHEINITFIGDIEHSRTIKSLVQILSIYNDKTYKIRYVGTDMNIDILENTDILYATRIQKERHAPGTIVEDYVIDMKYVKTFKKNNYNASRSA